VTGSQGKIFLKVPKAEKIRKEIDRAQGRLIKTLLGEEIKTDNHQGNFRNQDGEVLWKLPGNSLLRKERTLASFRHIGIVGIACTVIQQSKTRVMLKCRFLPGGRTMNIGGDNDRKKRGVRRDAEPPPLF